MEQQKNKKIAIVTPNAFTASETFIIAQIDLLPAAIVMNTGWLPTEIDGIPILDNKYKLYVNNVLRPILKCNLFTLENAIIKILKREKIEAVLAQYGPGGCAMIGLCKKANIPLYVHFHGFDASDENTLKAFSENYKTLFKEAKGIVAVSIKMVNKLIELGCPPYKITLNTYGPNDAFFNITSTYNSKTFIGIGRFVEKKAPYLTLLAFKEVLKKHVDAKLILGGEGPLLNTCKNIAKVYGIEDHVSFPGVVKPEEIRTLMESAIAFVQHSVVSDSGDSEGTPVAVLEASAAALPVIATWHAGIPDVVIDNITGILVNEYDIQAMTAAMIKLIENPDLAKEMGLAGRQRIKNSFTMEKYISRLRDLINTK